DPDRLVGGTDERRVGVGVGVNRDGRDPHRAARPHDPQRDLAAVRDQDLVDGPHQCLNTPHDVVPRTGAEYAADSAIAITVRVSRGSMMPSSHRRAVAKYGSLSLSIMVSV